jgi:trimeric autotransporter adhesin
MRPVPAIFLALVTSWSTSGQTYTISTVAGNGTQGFGGGDNGPATSAQLSIPRGVAVDSAGSLYIADSQDNRIRKVSGGVITTVAGNGGWGFTGDNYPATSTELNSPSGVAVDSAGNLYIADTSNFRIRKVSNGMITTVAGNGTQGSSGDNGPATSAQLYDPCGVAVDAAGNLYIADGSNNRIRKVSNGMITTVAGNGTQGFSGDNGPPTSAQLAGPVGVAVDAAGNLYIADTNNNTIRKVSNGVITTVAGSGGSGFRGDNGPATSAQLYGPCGVAVDSAGNLYVADSNNNRIRKVSNGVITTVAGNGTQGFSGDNGPATSAELAGPVSVAVDPGSDVYIADAFNNRIRVLTPAGPCTYSVSPTTLQAVAAGGSLTVSIQTTAICPWTISGVPSWTTVSGAASSTGSATVTFEFFPNSGATLSATILIAGVAVMITQRTAVFPFISAVMNAASYSYEDSPSPGEIVVIFGSGLGPPQLVLATVGSDGLFDTKLAGTTAFFNGIPAPMIYTSATQVAAIVPYEITEPPPIGLEPGQVAVQVTYQGQSSTTTEEFITLMMPAAPGLFTLDSTGQGQAAAINQDGITVNTPATPAKVGDVISLYATGEGQTTPAGVDGKPATPPYPTPNSSVSVTIGGVPAQVMYAGGAPGEVAGLMQVNAQIPSASRIQTGNAVPVVLQVVSACNLPGISGTCVVPSQAGVTISVAPTLQ